jgi:hypothetical protein
MEQFIHALLNPATASSLAQSVIGGALGNLLWCFLWNYESNYSRAVVILFIGPQPFRENHPSSATTAHEVDPQELTRELNG